MKFKSKKRIEIEYLLRASRQDFGFDSELVRARILMAANARHFSQNEAKRLIFKPAFWPRYALGSTIAIVLLAGTTGLAFASNQAKPGDALFTVQKFQNQIVLSLPLSETKKEEIRTDIAAKRLRQLDALKSDPKSRPFKVQAALEESQKSMDEAVSHLPEQKPGDIGNDSEPAKGNSESSKLDIIVSKLEVLSDEHASQIELLKKSADDQTKAQIEKNAISIKANNERLRRLRWGNKEHKVNDLEDKDINSNNNRKNTSD